MRLVWGEGGWVPDPAADGIPTGAQPPAGAPGPVVPAVADSFLLDDGLVRDLDVHEKRFEHSCTALGLATDAAATKRVLRFLAAARQALPATGRWFPRLEAHPGDDGGPAHLVCWLRPAPPLTDSVRLWVAPVPDPRSRPRHKGPDLAVLAGLRDRAHEHGADDAVLWNTDGRWNGDRLWNNDGSRDRDETLLETAHSALLWWRGEALCHPDPELPLLPSVTARRLLARARAAGITVKSERTDWRDVLDLEVWAVNALHGIRPVTSWRASDAEWIAPQSQARRLAEFRALLQAQSAERR